MRHRLLLWAGPAALLAFFGSTLALGTALPGYSPVRQTVSEIGMAGSPVATAFAASLIAVAVLVATFGLAVGQYAGEHRLSKAPALFVVAFGASLLGVAAFPSPDPWHNRFGLSETIGYLSPLVLAIAWRSRAGYRGIVAGSAIAFLLVLAAVVLNLLPAFVRVSQDYGAWYGLMQRALFAGFFGWTGGLGLTLYRRASPVGP